MALRVKEEKREDVAIQWYDSESYAQWIADYADLDGVKPFSRIPEFDEMVNGQKAFAVKIPRDLI